MVYLALMLVALIVTCSEAAMVGLWWLIYVQGTFNSSSAATGCTTDTWLGVVRFELGSWYRFWWLRA